MPFYSNNMNFIFNIEYFADLKIMDEKAAESNVKILLERNKELENFSFPLINLTEKYKELSNFYSHSLYTIYPGLMIGTGNIHNLKMESLIKCGFTFDYVTGMPYIPGSSLKGMLRSAFPGDAKDEETSKEYRMFIQEILGRDKTFNVEKLKSNIFENHDVFLGAYPVVSQVDPRLLQMEYITPHNQGEFKNPIPINMIKVKPNVKFEFCYKLHDYVHDGTVIVTAEEKKLLFMQLILLMGIGAKTNVGFGKFAVQKPKKYI